MTLLTVITVVKDDSPGLDRTLASMAAQAESDSDLVVIDSSTDRSEVQGALTRHAMVPASYEWCEPRGVYPAMNRGLELATGTYVYFLNAGDILAGQDVLASATEQLRAGQPAWAFGRVLFRQEDGSQMPEPSWDYAQERRHWFARDRFPAHQGVIVSTSELRRQGGFDTSYAVAADYASILRCAAAGPPLQLGLTLAEFSVGGLSTQKWQVAQAEFHRARREILAPTGIDAAYELALTWKSSLSARAYRSLWAPGRPAHSLVARLRGR